MGRSLRRKIAQHSEQQCIKFVEVKFNDIVTTCERKKNAKKTQKVLEIQFFAISLHTQWGKSRLQRSENAEIAQLVEHNLAKVGVASSSLVFRSKLSSYRNVAAFFVDGARLGGAPLMLPFQGLGRCEEYKKAWN